MPRLSTQSGPPRETEDVATAAARLGVSENHLREEISEGRFPVIRVGRRVLIPKQYLDRLLGVTP